MFHRLVVDPALKSATLRSRPRIVNLTGEISEETVDDVATALSKAVSSGQQRIPVVIHSAGGCVYTALRIVDMLKAVHVPVVTIVSGCAMSAAALIFSCGQERYISPHGTLMLHDVSLDMADGPSRVDDVEIESAELRRLNSKLWTLMAQNIGKPDDFFPRQFRSKNVDAYVTPEIAKRWNLATHVGVPVLKTTISCATEMILTDGVAPAAAGDAVPPAPPCEPRGGRTTDVQLRQAPAAVRKRTRRKKTKKTKATKKRKRRGPGAGWKNLSYPKKT